MDGKLQSILVIDPSADVHDSIDVHLGPEGAQIHHAQDAETGRQAIVDLRPDVVLLDLELPGMDGVTLWREIKEHLELSAILVIFLTRNASAELKLKALDVGATDFAAKPFDVVELRARVRSALRAKSYQELLVSRAQLNGLTGLWNKARFDEALNEEVALWQRDRQPAALARIDVDQLRRINEAHGYPFGDLVLRRIADTIRTALRSYETPFHLGGEELAVLFRHCDLARAERVAERLCASVAALALVDGATPVPVTASFGVASLEQSGIDSVARLVSCADQALQEAKHLGGNRVCKAVSA